MKYVRVVAPEIRRLGYRAWIYQGQLDSNSPAHIRQMSDLLHAAGAEVHYGFFPGGHDWGLWRAQLPRMLIAASNWFATAAAPGRAGVHARRSRGLGGRDPPLRRAARAGAAWRAGRRGSARAGRPGTGAGSSCRRPGTDGDRGACPREAASCSRAAMRSHRSTSRLLLGLLVAALGLRGRGHRPARAPAARCYGAASRDSEHPCFNRALLKAVTPRPIAALLETDAPVRPVRPWHDDQHLLVRRGRRRGAAVDRDRRRQPRDPLAPGGRACWRARRAGAARAWRARAARSRSASRRRCHRALRRSCIRHNRAMPGWLAAHPGIRTVFVAGNAGARVLGQPTAARASQRRSRATSRR